MSVYAAARCGEVLYIRVQGLANMKNVPILDGFVKGECESGIKEICINLSGCTGMDSTFMGTLVGFQQITSQDDGRTVVVNPGKDIHKLLDMLGVSAVVPVVEDHQLDCSDLSLENIDSESIDDVTNRMHLIKEAHERLVALNDENKEKFAPFLKALKKDLGEEE